MEKKGCKKKKKTSPLGEPPGRGEGGRCQFSSLLLTPPPFPAPLPPSAPFNNGHLFPKEDDERRRIARKSLGAAAWRSQTKVLSLCARVRLKKGGKEITAIRLHVRMCSQK